MTFIVRQIATTADGREIIRSNPFQTNEIGIGRSTTNPIHLPDLAVNPDHAVISKRDDGQIIVESTSGQNFTLDGKQRISVTIDPAAGAELGFGGHVIIVGEEGDDIVLTVKRVEALSDSAETRSESTLYTLKGLLPGKRMTAWGFIALVLAAFLVWPIYTWATWRGVEERPDQFHADTMWSTGALSKAHHGLEKDCQACHVDAFVTVTDNTCLTCHEDDAHDHAAKPRLLTARGGPEGLEKIGAAFASAFNKPPGRCVECHSEHEGGGAMQPTAQKFCADCHNGMDERLTDTKLENASDFGIEHPQFRPAVLVSPGGKNPERKRISLDQKPTEYNGLKFPHDLHLSKTGGVAQMGRRLSKEFGFGSALACKDCHTVDPKGVRFEPVDMKEDCSMCHSLAFDEIGGTVRTLRHGEPAMVQADLRAYYRSSRPNRPINLGGMKRRRPGENNEVRVASDYARAVQFRPSRANLAINQVFSRGGACFDCHGVTPPTARGRVDYGIKPVTQTDRYMEKGWFSHDAHNDEDCTSCHNATTSKAAEDLLLPGIKTCRECHGGEFQKSSDVPSSCAMCHDYHADDGAPWMVRDQKKDKQVKPEKQIAGR
ncbi:cytochrome c3 family protein [Parasphingorhabdus flavimaris]|jgi:predicted CXXCH cytochrome family protein|uniref:Cytochrome c3 family protein n=1 Tax=Parasphingorhabdus flavimaris TaxID=266812 RepID=A0ABX2N650_9SPHN|nr:cytochrome c3 family protein [Parasphingorhabdus flavimaris]NVD29168.1 cytochrome c3 family protein [Parasphingorhabdus flavimaris]|tara:strand:+ start:7371 stop:9176 length:1806 start_codon:yes stop_codon:yes gene_type:complete